jgi:hypothetical protein
LAITLVFHYQHVREQNENPESKIWRAEALNTISGDIRYSKNNNQQGVTIEAG